jgi:hypothetical protein
MTPLEQQQHFLNDIRYGPGYIGWKGEGSDFAQQHFQTPQDALGIVSAHREHSNVWCSMGSFRAGTSRSASNAISLKSFWLDVDAHGEGPHDTPEQALDAVKAFISSNCLPKPKYVNMTGHGVQVYWILPDPVSRSDWQPVAECLQELSERRHLGADTITADAARILRFPSTFNFRDPENPVEALLYKTNAGCIDLNTFNAALKAALAKLPPLPSKPQKVLPPGVADTPDNVALVKAMLSRIDPDSDYFEWRNTLWGLAASGLSASEDLGLEWSAQGADWDENAFYRVWNSYDPEREKAVGFGTLVFKAREAGYTGDIPQAEEKFDKLEFKNDTAAKVTITSKGLVTQRASNIEPEPVEWLIEGAIPMGMLVVIGGQPGMGKSQIAIKLAAAITTGEGLPDV